MLDVVIININNKKYTMDVVIDLLRQDTKVFQLTVIDQNSSESGTDNFLEKLEDMNVRVQRNDDNVDLNRVWNRYADESTNELICFLNNDIRLPSNFVSDTLEVFRRESNVGIVVHSTNHDNYIEKSDSLEYILESGTFRQGWDFSIRKEIYTPIANEIRLYCGDDFLFEHCYRQNYDVAYVLSSPILHYCSKSTKFRKVSGKEDVKRYRELGYDHNLRPHSKYTTIFPSDGFIREFNRLNK